MSPNASDDPIESAWQTLLADWESESLHRGFVGLAAALERLPDAAKRYRGELSHEARGARAQQGIDRVLAVAMQSLTPPTRADDRPPLNIMLPVTAFAAALTLTILAAQATGFRALASPVVIFGEAIIVALVPWRRFASRE